MKSLKLSAVAVALSLLVLTSCDFSQFNAYYYTANVQGYVVDEKSEAGVNGATVYLFTADPGVIVDAVPAGYFAKTASYASNNNDGFFTNKVIWNNPNGAYASEGDTTTLYAIVEQDNYQLKAFTLTGVLSDTTNTTANLQVKRITFTTPSVTGRVINVNGEGVNNVRVVCYLDPADATDDAATPDYTATTATVNNVTGTFTFNDVTWRDAASLNGTSRHVVKILVDDGTWEATDGLDPELVSGSNSDLSDTGITVTRQPTTDFSTNLAGRVFIRYDNTNGVTDTGVNGIHVKVTWTDENGAQTAETDTNNQGNWTVFVPWTDTTPGDYAATDTSIPEGEDGHVVTVTFTNLPAVAGKEYTFNDVVATANPAFSNVILQSWRNQNNFADGISNR